MTAIDPIWNEGGASGAGWSELASFFRCPKEYQYAQVRKILEPKNITPDYFFVGSAFHAGRAAWFSKKCAVNDATWAFITSEVARIRAEYEKVLPVNEAAVIDVTRYLTEFVEHYSMQPAPRVVAVEHMLGPTKLWPDAPAEHERTARLDDIGYYDINGDTLCIGECKTGSGTPAQIANEYSLHGQPMMQHMLWKAAPQGEAQYGPISGIVLDAVQKGYGGKKCKFGRVVLTVEPFALKWFSENLRRVVEATKALTLHGHADRNVTSCTRPRLGPGGRQLSGCQFRDLCTFGFSASGNYVKGPQGLPLEKEDCE